MRAYMRAACMCSLVPACELRFFIAITPNPMIAACACVWVWWCEPLNVCACEPVCIRMLACTCMPACTCMYICLRPFCAVSERAPCAFVLLYIHAGGRACMHACSVCAREQARRHACICMCVSVHMCMCVQARMCACITGITHVLLCACAACVHVRECTSLYACPQMCKCA